MSRFHTTILSNCYCVLLWHLIVHYEMEFMICDIAKLQNDFGRLILSVKATEAVVYKKYTMGNGKQLLV